MPAEEEVSFRRLDPSDAATFHSAATFQRYLADQAAGLRSVHLAVCRDRLAGHVTLLWTAEDPAFQEHGTPEISDLRVHAEFRGRGIGTALMERVEAEAASRCVRSRTQRWTPLGVWRGPTTLCSTWLRSGRLRNRRGGRRVPEGAAIRLDDDRSSRFG